MSKHAPIMKMVCYGAHVLHEEPAVRVHGVACEDADALVRDPAPDVLEHGVLHRGMAVRRRQTFRGQP